MLIWWSISLFHCLFLCVLAYLFIISLFLSLFLLFPYLLLYWSVCLTVCSSILSSHCFYISLFASLSNLIVYLIVSSFLCVIHIYFSTYLLTLKLTSSLISVTSNLCLIQKQKRSNMNYINSLSCYLTRTKASETEVPITVRENQAIDT